MSPDPEEIQHESVDREKPLRVHGGFEPAHLSLALSRRLMRTLCAALTPLYVKTAAQEASLSCWRVRKSLMTR